MNNNKKQSSPVRERKHRIEFYLSDDELKILNKKVSMHFGGNRSDFLRKLIIHGAVFEVDFSEVRENNRLIANAINNINQIARKVNTFGTIYSGDMTILKEKVDELWRLQKSMLSKLLSVKQ